MLNKIISYGSVSASNGTACSSINNPELESHVLTYFAPPDNVVITSKKDKIQLEREKLHQNPKNKKIKSCSR